MKWTIFSLTPLLAVTLATGIGQAQPPPPAPGGPPPPPPPNAPGGRATASRQGFLKAFNAGPAGDTNGLILTDGTLVLFPPDAGQQVASIVREGSRVSVLGAMRTGVTGRTLIDAQSITANGQTITLAGGPPPPAPPRGGPERGPRPGPGRAGPPPPPGRPDVP